MTNAPREFYKDVKRKVEDKQINAVPILGDACVWLLIVPDDKPNAGELVGYIFIHVDDFVILGNRAHAWFRTVRERIRSMYRWGLWETDNFRFAGVDLRSTSTGFSLSQEHYSATIPDLDIPYKRIHEKSEDPAHGLTPNEVTKGKGALGALQWLATQTQPLLSARVGLLQSRCQPGASPAVLADLQSLIREARANLCQTLELNKFPHVQDPTDLIVVGMGDASHRNRPKGGSTGGMVHFIAPPEFENGSTTKLSLVAWRSWRLERAAVGTNDAEAQAMHECEQATYRIRILWGEILGLAWKHGRDWVARSLAATNAIKGLLVTDSKGVYDAVHRNESGILGLSNARAAVQAYAVKESLLDPGLDLAWVSGDWNLSDALTKWDTACRAGLERYYRTWQWRVKFDPAFIVSEKKQIKKATQILEEEAGIGTNLESLPADQTPSINEVRSTILRG